MKIDHRSRLTLFLCFCMVAAATQCFGFTPAVGDVGYEFYNMANNMSTGAVGSTVALGGLSMAAFFLFKQQVLPAVGTALASVLISKASSTMSALGNVF